MLRRTFLVFCFALLTTSGLAETPDINLPLDQAKQLTEEKRYEEANEIYRLLAEQGDANALVSLANAYERGMGVTVDLCQQVNLTDQAARAGSLSAQMKMAAFYALDHEFPNGPQLSRRPEIAWRWHLTFGETLTESRVQRGDRARAFDPEDPSVFGLSDADAEPILGESSEERLAQIPTLELPPCPDSNLLTQEQIDQKLKEAEKLMERGELSEAIILFESLSNVSSAASSNALYELAVGVEGSDAGYCRAVNVFLESAILYPRISGYDLFNYFFLEADVPFYALMTSREQRYFWSAAVMAGANESFEAAAEHIGYHLEDLDTEKVQRIHAILLHQAHWPRLSEFDAWLLPPCPDFNMYDGLVLGLRWHLALWWRQYGLLFDWLVGR